MFRLTTLGSLALSLNGVDKPQPRRRLALLARLAPSGSVGVSRAELLAELWPERDTETARHNLDQLLYEMRRSLDVSPVVGTTSLRLDPGVISVDVLDFTSALERGNQTRAVALYAGAFLQGFGLPDAAEFERWVDSTRDRLAAQYRRSLEHLAKAATSNGAHDEAVGHWRKLVADDRLSSRSALGLMRALVDAGDSVGALEHARIYDRVVRSELEAAPDPAVLAFADTLRASGAPAPLGGRRPVPLFADTAPGAPAIPGADATPRSRNHLWWYAALPLLAVMGYGAFRWRIEPAARADRLPNSIVVLPMVDETIGRTDDRYADGLTEQLIAALANTSLKVIGRQSAFEFKNSRIGARAIADSLHVFNVLESTLQMNDSRLRVVVRLVDGATDLVRWQETYDRARGDIFDLQDDIVRSVARELHVQLVRKARRPTENVAANELYLHARDPRMFRSDSTIHFAIGLLDQAIELDSGFAAAYAAQAELYANAVWGADVGSDGRREMYQHALDAARQAIALDDSLADAHMALGIVSLYGYELREAKRELARARLLDPSLQGLSGWLGELYRWTGRPHESLAEARRELEVDPLSAGANAGVALALFFVREYDESLAENDKLLSLPMPMRRVIHNRAQIFLAQKRWDDAIASLRPSAAQLPRSAGFLGYALARKGERAEAHRLLGQLRDGVSTGRGNAFMVALIYAGLGQSDSAFKWLDLSIEEYTLYSAIMGPAFDELRADPRFARIRKRLQLD